MSSGPHFNASLVCGYVRTYAQQINLDMPSCIAQVVLLFYRLMENAPVPKWDIVYLTSSPLVFGNDPYKVLDQLDIPGERDAFFRTLEASKQKLRVMHKTATTSNMIALVTGGCRCIHYSGHDLSENLAFEDGRRIGETHLVQPHLIRTVCEDADQRIEFVFASYHSDHPGVGGCAGEAFVEAGVEHVVAVHTKFGETDEAASVFTQRFYSTLLRGQTIAKSFKSAKHVVAAMSSFDADKFRLLPRDGNHEVHIFATLEAGALVDDTDTTPVNNLSPAVPMFVGRAIDMRHIMQQLMDSGVRLLVLTGTPGVGKSATALMVARYFCDRRMFRDGIYYIDVKKLSAECDTLSSMLRRVFEECGVKEQQSNMYSKNVPTTVCTMGQLLLVLDGLDDLDPDSVRSFLQEFFEKCSMDTKVLVTTSKNPHSFGDVTNCITRYFTLRKLEPDDAAKLFSRLCNQFQVGDIVSNQAFMRILDYNPAQITKMAQIKHQFHCDTLESIVMVAMQREYASRGCSRAVVAENDTPVESVPGADAVGAPGNTVPTHAPPFTFRTTQLVHGYIRMCATQIKLHIPSPIAQVVLLFYLLVDKYIHEVARELWKTLHRMEVKTIAAGNNEPLRGFSGETLVRHFCNCLSQLVRDHSEQEVVALCGDLVKYQYIRLIASVDHNTTQAFTDSDKFVYQFEQEKHREFIKDDQPDRRAWTRGTKVQIQSATLGGWQQGTVVEVNNEDTLTITYGRSNQQMRKTLDRYQDDLVKSTTLFVEQRTQWQTDSEIEVYSHQQRIWCLGRIEEVLPANEQQPVDIFHVLYTNNDDKDFSKYVDRWSPDLRDVQQLSPTLAKYKKGTEVEVWSNSKQTWISGVVIDVVPTYQVVNVRYGDHEKLVPVASDDIRWKRPSLLMDPNICGDDYFPQPQPYANYAAQQQPYFGPPRVPDAYASVYTGPGYGNPSTHAHQHPQQQQQLQYTINTNAENVTHINVTFPDLANPLGDFLAICGTPDMYDDSKIEHIAQGEYNFEAEIGRGTRAIVFKGRWRGQEVAIKRFNKNRGIDAKAAKRYIDSCAMKLCANRHENVIRMFAYATEPFTLLTEYMNYGSVKRFVGCSRAGSTSISILDRIELACQAARGIAHLHSLDIVHTEINCQNLVMEYKPDLSVRVVLTDFGIPQVLSKEAAETYRASLANIKWLAPECLDEDTGTNYFNYTVNTKEADVYAFGITLWEIITGQDPYPDINPVDIAVCVLVKERRPQSDAFFPEGIQQVMKQCWHKNKTDRPTAERVVKTLSKLSKFIKRARATSQH